MWERGEDSKDYSSPVTISLTLGKLFYLSKPTFSFLKWTNNVLTLSWEFSEDKVSNMPYIKFVTHNKYPINEIKVRIYIPFQTIYTTRV